MSVPISVAACWVAMKIVSAQARDAQTWDPLTAMAGMLAAAPAGHTREVKLPDLSHAEALPLRVLARCEGDTARAIVSLRTLAAAACAL